MILAASSDAFAARETGGLLHRLFGDLPYFAELHFLLRKAGHLAAYGLLAALTWRADRRVPVALGFALMIAMVDEWHQSTIPSRTGTGWDVLLDVVGAAIAVGVMRWWRLGSEESRRLKVEP